MTSIVTARINFWNKKPEGYVVFNMDVSAKQTEVSIPLLCESELFRRDLKVKGEATSGEVDFAPACCHGSLCIDPLNGLH